MLVEREVPELVVTDCSIESKSPVFWSAEKRNGYATRIQERKRKRVRFQ